MVTPAAERLRKLLVWVFTMSHAEDQRQIFFLPFQEPNRNNTKRFETCNLTNFLNQNSLTKVPNACHVKTASVEPEGCHTLLPLESTRSGPFPR